MTLLPHRDTIVIVMEESKRIEITTFIRNQVTRGEDDLEALSKGLDGKPLPKRSAFLALNKRVRQFIFNRKNPNWIAVPGLRGSGKTTLLAQLYTSLNWKRGYKFYVSLDVARQLGFSLKEILEVYESLLGKPFRQLDTPVFLFLDEIQYEEDDWGTTLKVLTDNNEKVFVICTGSSALSLQINADVARRITYEKLFPLSFFEYIMIKTRSTLPYAKLPRAGLGNAIRDALFNSISARDVFEKLKKVESAVNSYWTGIDTDEVNKYLKYGTLPFTIQLPEEALIYARINQTLNNVLTKDVPELNKFDKTTIDRLSQVLYLVSSSEIISINKVAGIMSMDPKTMANIFDAFEKTEVLIRILPHGSHYKQATKPSKYIFSASAYRSMYYNLVGSVEQYQNYKGRLLEDVVGMFLYRIYYGNVGVSLTYDPNEGGADFIIDYKTGDSGRIALEVGTGRKKCDQAIKTLNKYGGKYGLIVSEGTLELHESHNCVQVPLDYFLLI